uniref:40S ribosomal protein S21 n=1 Tax=Physcomitrium patens TaxID=3218 RepID=A0A2K1IBM8_PHYPA|nr:hypothetical protein PHYPA_030157 [Physcomitrium patens]
MSLVALWAVWMIAVLGYFTSVLLRVMPSVAVVFLCLRRISVARGVFEKSLDLCTDCLCGCSSSTNRLITSKDVASVQLNVGHVDENGVYTGQFTTFALCGFVRAQGDADSALDRLWAKKKAELGQ